MGTTNEHEEHEWFREAAAPPAMTCCPFVFFVFIRGWKGAGPLSGLFHFEPRKTRRTRKAGHWPAQRAFVSLTVDGNHE